MTLPFDPSHVDTDDIGEEQIVIEVDYETAIGKVRNAVTDAGFGVPVAFSPSELLHEQVDADRDHYYVLGACNPGMADRALDVTPQIGALFPCNVVIWKEESGRQRVYHVSIMRMAQLVGIAPDGEEWDEIVEETGELVDQVFENLGELESVVESG